MGMYDSVRVACPDCGAEVEFQSKEGPCDLRTYTLQDCDPRIAIELNGEYEKCRACGGYVTFHSKSMVSCWVT